REEAGLARSLDEIDEDYVRGFLERSLTNGVILVAEAPNVPRLVGEIHTYGSGLRLFRHVLGELTVAVDPEYQGREIGTQLFQQLIDAVGRSRPDILRIELFARESNRRALDLYRSLGFVVEGRLERRIARAKNAYEADLALAWLRERSGTRR